MNTRDDDYLWSKTGDGDAEVERLERLLAPYALRTLPRPGARRGRIGQPRSGARRRTRRIAAALAASLAICALVSFAGLQYRLSWPENRPWDVAARTGQVVLDGGAPGAGTALAPGTEVRTGDDGAIHLRVARIGELKLGARSRLLLEETRSGRHRVRLAEGRMWARVWAPPQHFGVGVPGAEMIDLGCEFLVASDARGNGRLDVLSGWVLVETATGEVLVPQGASVRLRADAPAATPYDRGASAAFLEALRAIDARDGAVAADGPEIARLLAATRPQDAISLLSLLQRRPALARGPLYDRLRKVLPNAPPVPREAIANGAAEALDPWWDALPYPRAKRWWLQWPDALPSDGGLDPALRAPIENR